MDKEKIKKSLKEKIEKLDEIISGGIKSSKINNIEIEFQNLKDLTIERDRLNKELSLLEGKKHIDNFGINSIGIIT